MIKTRIFGCVSVADTVVPASFNQMSSSFDSYVLWWNDRKQRHIRCSSLFN